jgi:hypothetical protein
MANQEHLHQRLATLIARRDALAAELKDLLACVRQSRAIVGNPFFYSHPKQPDQSQANYTGCASHDVMRPTFWQFAQVEAEIGRLIAALNESCADDDDGGSH